MTVDEALELVKFMERHPSGVHNVPSEGQKLASVLAAEVHRLRNGLAQGFAPGTMGCTCGEGTCYAVVRDLLGDPGAAPAHCLKPYDHREPGSCTCLPPEPQG